MAQYGGTPMSWLNETPIVVVNACLANLPRVRASRLLDVRASIAAGTGAMTAADQRAYLRSLKAAMGRDDAKASTPSPTTLAAMGIAVRTVPKRVIHGE